MGRQIKLMNKKVLVSKGEIQIITVDGLREEFPADIVIVPRVHHQGHLVFSIGKRFQIPTKLFGNLKERASFLAESFYHYGRLNVLLEGVKGSGKTLLAKYLSNDLNLPTMLIDNYFDMDQIGEIYRFMEEANTPFLIIFDEFEKHYDREDQNAFLSKFDGLSLTNNFTIICSNEPLNEFFYNRPGRIRYRYDYLPFSLDETIEIMSEITEMSEEEIRNLYSRLFSVPLNYDILIAIAEDINRGLSLEDTIDNLNLKKESKSFLLDIKRKSDGKMFYERTGANPLVDEIFDYSFINDEDRWETIKWNNKDTKATYNTRGAVVETQKYIVEIVPMSSFKGAYLI